MSGFIRVRAVDGPKHEFHAAADEVAAHSDLYEVLDKTVVTAPEPPTYIVSGKKADDPKPVGEPTKEKD